MAKRITIIVLLLVFVALEANAQNRRHRRRGVILGGLAGAAIGAAIGDKGDNETAGALIGGAVGAVAGGTIGNQKDQRIEHNYRYHSGHGYYTQPRYRGHYHQGQYQGRPDLQYYQPRTFPQTTPYGSRPIAPVTPAQPIAPADAYAPTQPFAPSDPYAPSAPYAPAQSYSQPPSTTTPESWATSQPSAPTTSRDPLRPVSPQDVVLMVRSGMTESMILQQIEILGADRRLTVKEVIQLHRAGVSEPVLNAMQRAAPTTPNEVSKPISPLGPSILAPTNSRP